MPNRLVRLRVIAGIAASLVMLSGCHAGSARPAKPPRMMVARLAPEAAAGVIARGTIGGRPWGNVLGTESSEWSFPLGFKLDPDPALEGGGTLPQSVPMAVQWPARYIVLTLASGCPAARDRPAARTRKRS